MCSDHKTTADIVTRLRDASYMHPPRGMLLEAANVIEHLRGEQPADEASINFFANQTLDALRERNALRFRLDTIKAYVTDPKLMEAWDRNRQSIARGNKASGPRDWFESVLDYVAGVCDECHTSRGDDDE